MIPLAGVSCPACGSPFSALLSAAALEVAERGEFSPARGLGVYVGGSRSTSSCTFWHNYPRLARLLVSVLAGEHPEVAYEEGEVPGTHALYHREGEGAAEGWAVTLERVVRQAFASPPLTPVQRARLAEIDAAIARVDEEFERALAARRTRRFLAGIRFLE